MPMGRKERKEEREIERVMVGRGNAEVAIWALREAQPLIGHHVNLKKKIIDKVWPCVKPGLAQFGF